MPRNWRCGSGHTWAGEMGALLACPQCGSADVYEYRVPGQTDTSQLPPVPPPPGSEKQFAFPPSEGDIFALVPEAAAPRNPALDSTSIQMPALGATTNPGDTAIMPLPAKAPRRPIPPPPPKRPPPPPSRRSNPTPLQTPLASGGQFKETDIFPAVRLPSAPKPAVDPSEESTVDLPGESATDPAGTVVLETPADPASDATLIQELPSSAPTWTGEVHGTDATEMIDPPKESDTGHWAPAPGGDETAVTEPADGNSTGEFTAVADQGGDPSTGEFTPAAGNELPDTDVVAPDSAVTPGRRGQPRGAAYADTEERTPQAAPPKPKPGGHRAPTVEGYELLGLLGRGGMGVVYKARHLKLGRLVALKMILGGQHAGKGDRERFVLEAEAVAKLKHPNIVQIYDIGEHDGLPFFSLEFLDGGSLAEKSNDQPMPPKVAAEIVAQLADAMDYAHREGIVHRDLKPANVLFQKAAEGSRSGVHSGSRSGSHSGGDFKPLGDVPKVTDFGLAKKLEGDSGITGTGTILGTPSFMSPEQADGRTKEIGPATDIHALGAILYDLLTGRPPFLAADPMGTIMQVRQMEPVPPTRWVPGVPRDLENICLKCLQKPMAKRYATAGALADDLRRFLAGEPVLARPTPVWEKAYKWAKRRPTAAAVIGLSGLLALGVVGGSVLFAKVEHENRLEEARLTKEAQDSARQAHEARQATEAAKAVAVQQRDRAAADRARLRYVLDKVLTRMGDKTLRDVPAATALRSEFLDRATEVYADAMKAGASDNDLVREAGWAQQRAARLREALGEPQEAIAAYRKAADLFKKLAPDKEPDDRKGLADTHRQLMALYEKAGKPDDSDGSFNAAQALLSELTLEYPNDPTYRLEMASLLNGQGVILGDRRRPADAERAFRKAIDNLGGDESVDARLELARTRLNLTQMLAATGSAAKAADELRIVREYLGRLIAGDRDDTRYAVELARAANAGGYALERAGRPDAAEEAFRDAARQFGALSAAFPERFDYKFEWAKQRRNLARFLGDAGKRAEAREERAEARELFAALTEARPNDAEYRLFYGQSLSDDAADLDAEGRRSDALVAAALAADLLGKLAAANPAAADVQLGRARAVANHGKLLMRDAQEAKAEPLLTEAVTLYQDLVKSVGPHLAPELAGVYADQANLYRALNKPAQIDRALTLAAMTYDALARQAPDQPDAPAEAARLTAQRALDAVAQPAVAVKHLRQAVQWQREAVRRFRAQKSLAPRPEFEANLGVYGKALVEAQVNEGNAAGAAASVAELAELPPTWPGWIDVAALLSNAAGKADGAARTACCKQALACLQRAAEGGKLDAARLRDAPEFAAVREAAETKADVERLVAAKPESGP